MFPNLLISSNSQAQITEVEAEEQAKNSQSEQAVAEEEVNSESTRLSQLDTQLKFLHNPWFAAPSQEIGKNFINHF